MNTYPSTPKLRPTLWDGVVAALVAALAIVTILCFYGRRTGAPQAVTITHRGALIQTIRLTGLTGQQVGDDDMPAVSTRRRAWKSLKPQSSLSPA